ncbi:hypothetical protein RR46_05358 [Papilio xuthus]|uniref:Uncharacterized protein n=1 Tax=Papilio xuthus TaxID=66420 RepID=A0A194Q6D4_PAPXU|nr:hypothetical protein RR46_05358 [Papilio xuthus]
MKFISFWTIETGTDSLASTRVDIRVAPPCASPANSIEAQTFIRQGECGRARMSVMLDCLWAVKSINPALVRQVYFKRVTEISYKTYVRHLRGFARYKWPTSNLALTSQRLRAFQLGCFQGEAFAHCVILQIFNAPTRDDCRSDCHRSRALPIGATGPSSIILGITESEVDVLPCCRRRTFATVTCAPVPRAANACGGEGHRAMLRSAGTRGTVPHTLSIFDSCHRKIRLIGGGPVAFLGGLVA